MSHGLAPRPELPPEDFAAVVAIVQNHFAQKSEIAPDLPPAWRFSGRWFNTGPFANRIPM